MSEKMPERMKYCSNCETKKSVKEFGRNQSRKDGLQDWCKTCRSEYARIHKEKLATYKREYRAKHRKEILAKKRKYSIEHRAERAAYRRAHLSESAMHSRTSRLRYPIREKARQYVKNAIRDGRLIRSDRCSNPECNKICKPEAHHHNGYEEEHWLDVIFLCTECHKEADSELEERETKLEKHVDGMGKIYRAVHEQEAEDKR